MNKSLTFPGHHKIWLSAINHVDYDIDEKKGLGARGIL